VEEQPAQNLDSDPQATSEPTELEEPQPAETIFGDGMETRNLLSLTPLPTWRDEPVEIPLGEARGRFAISPDPNLDTSETEPGSLGGEELPDVEPGDGPLDSGEASPLTNLGPVVNISFGTRPQSEEPGDGNGNIGGTGNGDGGSTESGSGSSEGSGPGSDSGSGFGSESGSGSGSTPGPGSGSGAGAGTGKKPFAGITIVGGSGTAGASTNSIRVTPPPRPVKTSYGLFIVSTENSGGGLPSFGLFTDEQVYTVYLDMREKTTDQAPSWTLEFAVLRGTTVKANEDEDENGGREGLLLPFPAVKKRPEPPPQLVRPHLGKTLIVYAIINTQGRMEQIEIKDSPDASLNEFVLKALSQWVFRPAVFEGEPVTVKALLGIPLWLPE
jgi:hypothetical protein